MGTFWMVVWLFASNGEFTGKLEYEYSSKAACEAAAPKVAKKHKRAEIFCVSDDHFFGRKQDENVPYD